MKVDFKIRKYEKKFHGSRAFDLGATFSSEHTNEPEPWNHPGFSDEHGAYGLKTFELTKMDNGDCPSSWVLTSFAEDSIVNGVEFKFHTSDSENIV